MVTKQQLIDAYADWLGEWDWDWFGTLTHPGYPSRHKLEQKFNGWISELEKEQGTRNFRYAMVMERGAYGDNKHIHVLVGGLKRKVRRFPWPWRDRWQKVAGQAVVGLFDPRQGGIRYLLKTLLPDNDFEITMKFQERPKARISQ
jgi:hypothetical protein